MGALQSSEQRRLQPRCSLQRLAKVELQLVLQFLDPISRLRAARCSRTLFAAADSEVAWTHGLFVIRLPLSNQSALIRSSLLRRALISLHVPQGCMLRTAEVVHAVPRRLRELRIDAMQVEGEMKTLLAHPALEQLQSLHFDSYPPPSDAALDLASCLPLHSLSLWVDDNQPDLMIPLRSMHALADLTLSAGGQRITTHLPTIGQLTQLRSLRLDNVAFGAGELRLFFASAVMCQLRHLAIDSPPASVPLPSADEQRAAFASLERLESLRLRHVPSVDALLAHLHCAPSLRLLIVECAPQSPGPSARLQSQHPSTAALQSLLSTAPLLSVRLEGPPLLERWLSHPRVQNGRRSAAFNRALEVQWEALHRIVLELSPRVKWLAVPDE